MADEKSARSKGVVAKFDDHKSYGFIQLDDGGEDLFVHQTADFRNLRDQAVEFTIVLKDENSKAVDVTAPGEGLVRRGDDINNRGGNGGGYGFGDRRNGPGRGGVGGECYNCGEFGHMDRDCFGRIGGGANGSSCYNCGGMGIWRGCVQLLAASEVETVELVLPVVMLGKWRGTVWVVEAIVEVVILGGPGRPRQQVGGGKCFNCGKSGHFLRNARSCLADNISKLLAILAVKCQL